jgi:hypothetical protein
MPMVLCAIVVNIWCSFHMFIPSNSRIIDTINHLVAQTRPIVTVGVLRSPVGYVMDTPWSRARIAEGEPPLSWWLP